MVDTLDSGSSAGNCVEVRLLSRAPKQTLPPGSFCFGGKWRIISGMKHSFIKELQSRLMGSVTDAPERSLAMVARIPVDLADVLLGEEAPFCDTLDRCKEVSLFLLDHAPGWLAES